MDNINELETSPIEEFPTSEVDVNRPTIAFGDSLPSGIDPQYPYGLFEGVKQIDKQNTGKDEIVRFSLPQVSMAYTDEERTNAEIATLGLFATVDKSNQTLKQTTTAGPFSIDTYIGMSKGEGVENSTDYSWFNPIGWFDSSTRNRETIGEQELNRQMTAGSGVRGMFAEQNREFNSLMVRTANSDNQMYPFDANTAYDWAGQNLTGKFGTWVNSVGKLIGWVDTTTEDMDAFNTEQKLKAQAPNWTPDVAYQATKAFLASNPQIEHYFSVTGVDPHEFTRLTKNPFAWVFQMNNAVIQAQSNLRLGMYEQETGWIGGTMDKLYYGVKDPTLVRDMAVTTLASYGFATSEMGLYKLAELGAIRSAGLAGATRGIAGAVGRFGTRGISGGPMTGPIESFVFNTSKSLFPSIGHNGFMTASARGLAIMSEAAVASSISAAHMQKDAYDFEHLVLNFGPYKPGFEYDTDQILAAGFEGGALGLAFFGAVRLGLGLKGDIAAVREAPEGMKFKALSSAIANSLDGFSTTPDGRTIFGNRLSGNRGILFGDLMDNSMKKYDNRNTAGVIVNGKQLWHFEGFNKETVAKANFNEEKAREVQQAWQEATNTVAVPDSLVDPEQLAKSGLTYDDVIETLKVLKEVNEAGLKQRANMPVGFFETYKPYGNFKGRLLSEDAAETTSGPIRDALIQKAKELEELEAERTKVTEGRRSDIDNLSEEERKIRKTNLEIEIRDLKEKANKRKEAIDALNKEAEPIKQEIENIRQKEIEVKKRPTASVEEEIALQERIDNIKKQISVLERQDLNTVTAKTAAGKKKQVAELKAKRQKLKELKKQLTIELDKQSPLDELLIEVERERARLTANETNKELGVLNTQKREAEDKVFEINRKIAELEKKQKPESEADARKISEKEAEASVIDRYNAEDSEYKTKQKAIEDEMATLKDDLGDPNSIIYTGRDLTYYKTKEKIYSEIRELREKQKKVGRQKRLKLQKQIDAKLAELKEAVETDPRGIMFKVTEDVLSNNMGFGTANVIANAIHILNVKSLLAESERAGIPVPTLIKEANQILWERFAAQRRARRVVDLSNPQDLKALKIILHHLRSNKNAETIAKVFNDAEVNLSEKAVVTTEHGGVVPVSRVKELLVSLLQKLDTRTKAEGEPTVIYVSTKNGAISKEASIGSTAVVRIEIDSSGKITAVAETTPLKLDGSDMDRNTFVATEPTLSKNSDFVPENTTDPGTIKVLLDSYREALDVILKQKDKERIELIKDTLETMQDEVKAALTDAEADSIDRIKEATTILDEMKTVEEQLDLLKQMRELTEGQLKQFAENKNPELRRQELPLLFRNLFILEGMKEYLTNKINATEDAAVKAKLQEELDKISAKELSVNEAIRINFDTVPKGKKAKVKKAKVKKPKAKKAKETKEPAPKDDLAGLEEAEFDTPSTVAKVQFNPDTATKLTPTRDNLKLVFGFNDSEALVGSIVMKALGMKVSKLVDTNIKLAPDFVSEADAELARIYLTRTKKGVQAIIAANKQSDLFSLTHEMGHYLRYLFLDPEASIDERAKLGITDDMYENVMKWLGASKNEEGKYKLTLAQEEKFANGAGLYIRKLLNGEGKASNTGIQFVFNKLGEHLGSLSESFKTAQKTEGVEGLELTPEAEAVYSVLLRQASEDNIEDIFREGFSDLMKTLSDEERNLLGQKILGKMRWEAYKAKLQKEVEAAAEVTSAVVETTKKALEVPVKPVEEVAAKVESSEARLSTAKTPEETVDALADTAESNVAATRIETKAVIADEVSSSIQETVEATIPTRQPETLTKDQKQQQAASAGIVTNIKYAVERNLINSLELEAIKTRLSRIKTNEDASEFRQWAMRHKNKEIGKAIAGDLSSNDAWSRTDKASPEIMAKLILDGLNDKETLRDRTIRLRKKKEQVGINKEGENIVFYHGSLTPVKEWRNEKLGMFFTPDRTTAARFGVVSEVHIDLPFSKALILDPADPKNPIKLDSFMHFAIPLSLLSKELEAKAREIMAQDTVLNGAYVTNAKEQPTAPIEVIAAAAKESGYKGLLVRKVQDTDPRIAPADQLVVFDPKVIKPIEGKETIDFVDNIAETLKKVSKRKKTKTSVDQAKETIKAADEKVADSAETINENNNREAQVGETIVQEVENAGATTQEVAQVREEVAKKITPDLSFLGDRRSPSLDLLVDEFRLLREQNAYLSKIMGKQQAQDISDFNKLKNNPEYQKRIARGEGNPEFDIERNLTYLSNRLKEEADSETGTQVMAGLDFKISKELENDIAKTATKLQFKLETFQLMLRATYAIEKAQTDHLKALLFKKLKTIKETLGKGKKLTPEQRQIWEQAGDIVEVSEEAKALSIEQVPESRKVFARHIANAYLSILLKRNKGSEDAVQKVFLDLLVKDNLYNSIVERMGPEWADETYLNSIFDSSIKEGAKLVKEDIAFLRKVLTNSVEKLRKKANKTDEDNANLKSFNSLLKQSDESLLGIRIISGKIRPDEKLRETQKAILEAEKQLHQGKVGDPIYNLLQKAVVNNNLMQKRSTVGVRKTTKYSYEVDGKGELKEVITEEVVPYSKEGSYSAKTSAGEVDVTDDLSVRSNNERAFNLDMSIESAKAAIKSGHLFTSLYKYIKDHDQPDVLRFFAAKLEALRSGDTRTYKSFILKMWEEKNIRDSRGMPFTPEKLRGLEKKSEQLIGEWLSAVERVEPSLAAAVREILPGISERVKAKPAEETAKLAEETVTDQTSFAQTFRVRTELPIELKSKRDRFYSELFYSMTPEQKAQLELQNLDVVYTLFDGLPGSMQTAENFLSIIKKHGPKGNPAVLLLQHMASNAPRKILQDLGIQVDRKNLRFRANIDIASVERRKMRLSALDSYDTILHEFSHGIVDKIVQNELTQALKEIPDYVNFDTQSRILPMAASLSTFAGLDSSLNILGYVLSNSTSISEGTRKILSAYLDYADAMGLYDLRISDEGVPTGEIPLSKFIRLIEPNYRKWEDSFGFDTTKPLDTPENRVMVYQSVRGGDYAPSLFQVEYRPEGYLNFSEVINIALSRLQDSKNPLSYEPLKKVLTDTLKREFGLTEGVDYKWNIVRQKADDIKYKKVNAFYNKVDLTESGKRILNLSSSKEIVQLSFEEPQRFIDDLTNTKVKFEFNLLEVGSVRFHADRGTRVGLPYGSLHLGEFIAQTFNDAAHAETLNYIPSSFYKSKSLLRTMYEAIRELLHITFPGRFDEGRASILQVLLSGAEELIQKEQPVLEIKHATPKENGSLGWTSFPQSRRTKQKTQNIEAAKKYRQQLKTAKGRWFTLARKLQTAINAAIPDNEEIAGIKVEMENLQASMSVARKALRGLGLSEEFSKEDLEVASKLIQGLNPIDDLSVKLGIETGNRIILNDILEEKDPEVKMLYIKAFEKAVVNTPEVKPFLTLLKKMAEAEQTWLSRTADDLAEDKEEETKDPTRLREMNTEARRAFLINTFFPTLQETLGDKAGPQNILSKFFEAVPGGSWAARKFQAMSGGGVSFGDTANSPFVGLAFLAKMFDPNIDVRNGELTGNYKMPSMEKAEAEAKLILTSSGIPEARAKIVDADLSKEELVALNDMAWRHLTKPEEIPEDTPHRDLIIDLITARNKFNTGVAEYLKKYGYGFAKLEEPEKYGTSHRPSEYARNNPDEFVAALTKHEVNKYLSNDEFNGATLHAIGWIEIVRSKTDGGVDRVIILEDSPVAKLFDEDEITKADDKRPTQISWNRAKKKLKIKDEEGNILIDQAALKRYYDALQNVTEDYTEEWRTFYKNFKNPTAIFISMRTAKDRILKLPEGESDNKSLLPKTFFANKASDYTEERLFTHDELIADEDLSKFYSNNILGLTIEETNTRLFQHVVTKDLTELFGVKMTMDDLLEMIRLVELNYVRDIDTVDEKTRRSFFRGWDKLKKSWLHKTHRLSTVTSDYDKNYRWILDSSHGFMMALGGLSAGGKTVSSEVIRALLASDRNRSMVTQFLPNLYQLVKYTFGLKAGERRLEIMKMASAIHWTRAVLEDTFSTTYETMASRNDYQGPVFGRQGFFRNLSSRWDSLANTNKSQQVFSDKSNNVVASMGWLFGGLLRYSNEMVNVISMHNALKNMGENIESMRRLSTLLENYSEELTLGNLSPRRADFNRLARSVGLAPEEALDLSRSGLLRKEYLEYLHTALTKNFDDVTTEGLPDSSKLLRWAETLPEDEQKAAKEAVYMMAGYIKTLARNTNIEPTLLDTRVTTDPVARMLRLYTQFGTSNAVQAVGRSRRSGNIALSKFLAGQLLMQVSSGVLFALIINGLDKDETYEEIKNTPIAFLLTQIVRMPVYGNYGWLFKALALAAYSTYAHLAGTETPKSIGKFDIPDLVSSPFQYRFDAVTKDLEKMPGLFLRLMDGKPMSPRERQKAIDSIPFMDNILLGGFLKDNQDIKSVEPVIEPLKTSNTFMPKPLEKARPTKGIQGSSTMAPTARGPVVPPSVQPPVPQPPREDSRGLPGQPREIPSRPIGYQGVSGELADLLEQL